MTENCQALNRFSKPFNAFENTIRYVQAHRHPFKIRPELPKTKIRGKVSYTVSNQQRSKCEMHELKAGTENQGCSQNRNQQVCIKKGNQMHPFVRQNHTVAFIPCNYLCRSSPSWLLPHRQLEVLCFLLTPLSGGQGLENNHVWLSKAFR